MKTTHKKVLGFLGLILVVATTVFAATLPSPGASAAITSVVDNISVRVVGSVPDINITDIENGEITTSPSQSFSVSYENVDTITVTLQYTDENGDIHTYVLDTLTPDYYPGVKNYTVDLGEADYGYGEYLLVVKGVGYDGVYDEDTIAFSYYPVYAEATEDEDTGNYIVDLDYDADDGTEDGGEVASIVINVYDENGNLVDELSPITVTPPTTSIELPFADLGLPSGTYTVVVAAYDANGEKLYKDYVFTIKYEAIEVPNTADTGRFLQNLNISKADYLITGLMIFFLVAVAGVVFITRSEKKKAPARVNVRSKSHNKSRKRR